VKKRKANPRPKVEFFIVLKGRIILALKCLPDKISKMEMTIGSRVAEIEKTGKSNFQRVLPKRGNGETLHLFLSVGAVI
jgi:hypothetical protein